MDKILEKGDKTTQVKPRSASVPHCSHLEINLAFLHRKFPTFINVQIYRWQFFLTNPSVINFVTFVQLSQLTHLNESYKIKVTGTCQKIFTFRK